MIIGAMMVIGFMVGWTAIHPKNEKEFSLKEAEARIEYAQAFYQGEKFYQYPLREMGLVPMAKGYLPLALMDKNLTVAELLEMYDKYPAVAKNGLEYVGKGLCK